MGVSLLHCGLPWFTYRSFLSRTIASNSRKRENLADGQNYFQPHSTTCVNVPMRRGRLYAHGSAQTEHQSNFHLLTHEIPLYFVSAGVLGSLAGTNPRSQFFVKIAGRSPSLKKVLQEAKPASMKIPKMLFRHWVNFLVLVAFQNGLRTQLLESSMPPSVWFLQLKNLVERSYFAKSNGRRRDTTRHSCPEHDITWLINSVTEIH